MGEELSDVVRPVYRSEMEDLLSGLQIDSPVFHGTGIPAAGSIYGQTVQIESFGQSRFACRFRRLLLRRMQVMVGGRSQCGLRFFTGLERFVEGSLVVLDLQLAVGPGSVYSGGDAFPYNVIFLFGHVWYFDGQKYEI